MADWISLREFARRRNVTLGAVQKAIATGRITAGAVRRDDDHRLRAIDADQAAIDWSRNTDPELALRSGTVVLAPDHETPTREQGATSLDDALAALVAVGAESAAPRAQTSTAGGASPDRGAEADRPLDSFHADRARNEEIKRINGELDLALRLKQLVSVEAVQRAAHASARQVHDELMRLPERVAPLVAAEVDVVKIQALISHEIRQVLEGLANHAAELAAA